MSYRIGIDAGSKTIKVVVVDEHGTLVHSLYRRHRSDIKTTLAEALHDLAWRHGDLEGTVGVTGSAGIGVAELLGLPFVQEVIATTHAVQCAYPEADAIIELGGEDAKVVYLTGGLEQRMNATCAGGTGGFIDTMAFMLGTSSKNMSSLALGANRIYPIASRCAVFAQTDVRPLLNAGARTSDLAASALEAVVRQTLGGLACGRPIKGTVVFLGGPLEHIPDLVQRFRTALGISHKEGIKPPDAHLFTAMGAALVAAEEAETKQKARGAEGEPEAGEPREALDAEGEPEAGTPEVGAARGMRGAEGTAEAGTAKVEAPEAGTPRNPHDSSRAFVHSLSELEERVRQATNPENDLVRLPPLFASEDELREFRTRHEGARMERVRLFDCTGPLYLGLDAGSTAVKLAVLDEAGRLAYSDYHATDGDALKTAADMLADLFVALPRSANGTPYAHIAHATVTGYGEDLLRAGLGIDSGVVETLAHVRAAQQFQPDLTFLLDIGGQDMKAIWVRDGRVANAVLNEACSSGCGSFIEGTAHSLRSTPYRFAAAALEAREPVDLGTKCTVFMTSRVRHAQKIGVETQDIAAGIAYSVVKNALFRIIGMSQLDSLGPHVVVQGGAFMSDAVLRAFELVGGIEAVRPDTAHLMGAIGAALTARLRANTLRKEGGAPKSSLVGAQELAALDPRRTAMRCTGCENVCALSIVEFATGRRFISGNRCDRAQACVERALKEKARTRSVGAGAMGAYTGARNAVPAGERTGAQAAAPSPDSARLPGKDAADPAPAGTHAGASNDVPASNMPPARADAADGEPPAERDRARAEAARAFRRRLAWRTAGQRLHRPARRAGRLRAGPVLAHPVRHAGLLPPRGRRPACGSVRRGTRGHRHHPLRKRVLSRQAGPHAPARPRAPGRGRRVHAAVRPRQSLSRDQPVCVCVGRQRAPFARQCLPIGISRALHHEAVRPLRQRPRPCGAARLPERPGNARRRAFRERGRTRQGAGRRARRPTGLRGRRAARQRAGARLDAAHGPPGRSAGWPPLSRRPGLAPRHRPRARRRGLRRALASRPGRRPCRRALRRSLRRALCRAAARPPFLEAGQAPRAPGAHGRREPAVGACVPAIVRLRLRRHQPDACPRPPERGRQALHRAQDRRHRRHGPYPHPSAHAGRNLGSGAALPDAGTRRPRLDQDGGRRTRQAQPFRIGPQGGRGLRPGTFGCDGRPAPAFGRHAGQTKPSAVARRRGAGRPGHGPAIGAERRVLRRVGAGRTRHPTHGRRPRARVARDTGRLRTLPVGRAPRHCAASHREGTPHRLDDDLALAGHNRYVLRSRNILLQQ